MGGAVNAGLPAADPRLLWSDP